jgi:putative transposase
LKSVGSYSFYSKELNKNKYNEFVKKAIAIREFKNQLSELISSDLINFLDLSKFDIVKKFGTQKDNPLNPDSCLRGNEIQKAVVDVMTAYENRFDQLRSKISFSVQKSLKVTYYKRKSGLNKKGDVRTREIVFKSTKLTKVLSFLGKYGFTGITEDLKSRTQDSSDKSKFFIDVVHYLEKYGEERLLRLAISKRLSLLEKYKQPIVFKTLSYRSALQSQAPFIQNHKGFTNAFIIIPGMNGRKMVVPTKFSLSHHGHLNQYKSREYTVVVEEKRIRFITTKPVTRNFSTQKTNFVGVDTNLKHNLFSTSLDKTIDYDRKLFSRYVSFLKKIDKEKKTDGEVKQFKLWQQRMKSMLQEKSSELVKLAISHGKDHIIMEDLGSFGRSMVRGAEFENFKFSRLVRLLNLSNLNNLVRSICQKKGLQFTKIPSHYTSQLCSKCGTISRENRKTQELFECSGCSEKRNADYNSSINIHLIGESEVLAPKMLVKDTSSWLVPKVLKKDFIKSYLEDMVTESAFQQRRENLIRLANSS